jgi:transcriptional regulator with XRE-family HTH domain
MVSRHSLQLGLGQVAVSRQAAVHERPVQLVGRRLRRLRKERRLSVETLAAAAGIQAGDLQRLEKGEYRASLDVLFRILGALEVSGDAFFAAAAQEGAAEACFHEVGP